MRGIFVVAMMLLGSMGAALAAPVFDDPRALIEYVYAPYLNESDPFPDDPSELYSPTLKQLWDEMSAKSPKEPEPERRRPFTRIRVASGPRPRRLTLAP